MHPALTAPPPPPPPPPQTVVTIDNGKLVQKQTWEGKETAIEREIEDGKLVAVSALFFPLYVPTLHALNFPCCFSMCLQTHMSSISICFFLFLFLIVTSHLWFAMCIYLISIKMAI